MKKENAIGFSDCLHASFLWDFCLSRVVHTSHRSYRIYIRRGIEIVFHTFGQATIHIIYIIIWITLWVCKTCMRLCACTVFTVVFKCNPCAYILLLCILYFKAIPFIGWQHEKLPQTRMNGIPYIIQYKYPPNLKLNRKNERRTERERGRWIMSQAYAYCIALKWTRCIPLRNRDFFLLLWNTS